MYFRDTKSKLILIPFILILLLFLFPILLHAATFTVNDTADTVDVSPGDSVCADGGGNCTLRAAITEANALAGADIIDLPVGTYTLSIGGGNEDFSATGDLDVTDDLTINGAAEVDTIIDANAIDRVLHIIGAVTEISDVTLMRGNLPFGCGGGILNAGTATLINCTISGNSSAGEVGGICNEDTATLTNCTISNNDSDELSGGIWNGDTATLTNCTISDNLSGAGDGAGIVNNGTVTLSNCTISNNDAGFGGIENVGTATLTNCTISGNDAQLEGGGIKNDGTATLTNCTISDNAANQGGGIWNSGTVEIENSIVANNTIGGDCFGGITSLDYNLDSDSTCKLIQPNDLPNTDPLLGAYTDDGDPGRGHFPLLNGSPAIDSGNDADCPLTDQLGNPRVDGDDDGFIVCDIGAIEFQIEDPPDDKGGGGGGSSST